MVLAAGSPVCGLQGCEAEGEVNFRYGCTGPFLELGLCQRKFLALKPVSFSSCLALPDIESTGDLSHSQCLNVLDCLKEVQLSTGNQAFTVLKFQNE